MSEEKSKPAPHSPSTNLSELQAALGQKYGSRLAGEEFSWPEAFGGGRGLVESVLPTLVFVVAFVVTRQVFTAGALALGLSVGLIIARLISKQSISQSLAGFMGVVIGVAWAMWSGRGEDYFALGLWTNAAYLVVFLGSILLRYPLIGVMVGFFREQGLRWHHDEGLRADRKSYYVATWLWVIMFALRLAVKVPLFFAGSVAWLGTFQLVLGVPLFALVLWLCWLALRRPGRSFLDSGLPQPTGGADTQTGIQV